MRCEASRLASPARSNRNVAQLPGSLSKQSRMGSSWRGAFGIRAQRTQPHPGAQAPVGVLRGIGEIATGRNDDDHLGGNGLELRPEMAGALEAQDLLLGGLDAKMPEGCLVQRLHALAGHGDADTADA